MAPSPAATCWGSSWSSPHGRDFLAGSRRGSNRCSHSSRLSSSFYIVPRASSGKRGCSDMDFLNPSFWLFVAVIAGIYGIMALGLYVQYSLAGLPNFGHVAFMAVAAYAMAILVVRYDAPLILAGLAGLLAAVVLALVMGLPALRLRADYLAIAT